MYTKPHLLVLIPIQEKFLVELKQVYTLHYAPEGWQSALMESDIREAIRALLTNGSTGLNADQMVQLPSLELICSYGAGYENVDLAAAQARGIAVTHAPGVNNATVADHALALMLAIARGLVSLNGAVKAGAWNSSRGERPTVNGKRLGLLGMGNIGEQIARRAAAFDMRIGYHARQARPDSSYHYYSTLSELAENSDYLIVACPGGPATYQLVNAEILSKLGSDGFLINIARGSIVDTSALIHALQHRVIAGAALDVIDGEPVVPAELLQLDNVILTPHISGRSPEAQSAQHQMLMANLAAHFAAQHLLTPVSH